MFWCNVVTSRTFTKINLGTAYGLVVWPEADFSLGLCYFPSSVFFRLFSIWKWVIDSRKQTAELWGTVKFLNFLLKAQSSLWLVAFFFLQWVNYICFVLHIFVMKKWLSHWWNLHLKSYHLKNDDYEKHGCIFLPFWISNKYAEVLLHIEGSIKIRHKMHNLFSCCHSQTDWLVIMTLRLKHSLTIGDN